MSDYLERARQEGTPLIDGEIVTFVWKGDRAPFLIADFTDWLDAPVLLEKAGKKTWIYTRRLQGNAYMEYAYWDSERKKRLSDPFNLRTVPNGLGQRNHFFYMPEAVPSQLVHRRRGVARGKVTRHVISTRKLLASASRSVYLYQPASAAPSPLIVVFDGDKYLRLGKLPQILDNLIAQERIRPVAVAMAAGGGSARYPEYACSESTLAFLLQAVLPLAQAELNLLDVASEPGAYGALGASMGGLMAFFAGMRFPEVFGRILSQSGSFRYFGSESVVRELVRYAPTRPLKIWLDASEFEQLRQANREIYNDLLERGYAVNYREYPGGHNFTSWRNEIWRGLEALYPPEMG